VVMSPRPGRITEIVPGTRPGRAGSGAEPTDLVPDDVEDVRESGAFFAAITAVREALRKGHES
jgi:NitT/TauT family transport system ATP-binding protein